MVSGKPFDFSTSREYKILFSFYLIPGTEKRIQKLADQLLSAEEERAGIQHKASVSDGRASLFCYYCKQDIALGSVSQGITNFRLHTISDKHKGNQHSGEKMAAKTAEIVRAGFDKGVFMVKDSQLFCRPCQFQFANCKSVKQLQHNVSVHERKSAHISLKRGMSGMGSLTSFFSKATKTTKADHTPGF